MITNFVLVIKNTRGRRTRTGLLQKMVARVYHRPECRHIPTEERMDRSWAYEFTLRPETHASLTTRLRELAEHLAGGGPANPYDIRACGSCRPELLDEPAPLSWHTTKYGDFTTASLGTCYTVSFDGARWVVTFFEGTRSTVLDADTTAATGKALAERHAHRVTGPGHSPTWSP